MKSELIYQLVDVYDHFKLYDVYKNMIKDGAMRKVFLYKTTFPKIKTDGFIKPWKDMWTKYNSKNERLKK